MRGKVKEWDTESQILGITPAYAGKRSRVREMGKSKRDHPRLCGEKPEHGKICLLLMGSPPPMRGKGLDRFDDVVPDRITPAYAGKRIPHGAVFVFLGDHPRLCGEKLIPAGFVFLMLRITPAYAGKSLMNELTNANS